MKQTQFNPKIILAAWAASLPVVLLGPVLSHAEDSTYPPISNMQSVQNPGGTGASTTPGATGGAAGGPPASGTPGAGGRTGGVNPEPFQSGSTLQGNTAIMNEYDEADKKSGGTNYYIDSAEDLKRKAQKEENQKKIEEENAAERNKDVFDYWKQKKKSRDVNKKEIQKDEKEANEYFESPDF